jgi:hypothetical protein
MSRYSMQCRFRVILIDDKPLYRSTSMEIAVDKRCWDNGMYLVNVLGYSDSNEVLDTSTMNTMTIDRRIRIRELTVHRQR